jgi:hypothetical protein
MEVDYTIANYPLRGTLEVAGPWGPAGYYWQLYNHNTSWISMDEYTPIDIQNLSKDDIKALKKMIKQTKNSLKKDGILI